MRIVRVPTPAEGNPLYPLPADYEELTASGQRMARVNAGRQWLLDIPSSADPPPIRAAKMEARASAFASCCAFFDAYYLRDEHAEDGSVIFAPLFHKFILPEAPFHRLIDRASMLHRKLVDVSPRGSAKSTREQIRVMLQMTSMPQFEVLYATASTDLAESIGEAIKYQLYTNSRLQDDWGPEYGGTTLRPLRGEAKQGMTGFALTNRAMLTTTSPDSRQRGKRPHLYVLDDPEYDGRQSTSMEVRREYMEWLVFRVILPMVNFPGTSVRWHGTFISRRHYLWLAMSTNRVVREGRVVEEAVDPRFSSWYRIFIPAAVPDGRGGIRSTWPHRWPRDAQERERLGLDPATMTIPEIERELGTPAFLAEMMGRPGDAEQAFFGPLDEERHGWSIDPDTADEALESSPWRSRAVIRYHSGSIPVRRTVADLLADPRVYRFMACDNSWTHHPGSDRKTAAFMALTAQNDLLILDLWSARCPPSAHKQAIFRMANRWRAPAIFVEQVHEGAQLAAELTEAVATRAVEITGTSDHFPIIRPFHPGTTSKPARIASMHWRFHYGKVKFPLHLRHAPPWRDLFEQVAQFNPYAPGGGLQHDDELDTVQMSRYAIRSVPRDIAASSADAAPRPPLQRLREGEVIDRKSGLPVLCFAGIESLSRADIDEILRAREVAPSSGGDGEIV